MFYLSKIVWAIIAPVNLFIILGIASVVCLWIRPLYKIGRIGFTVFFILMVIIVIFPIDGYVLRPLEERFPPLRVFPDRVNGVIVLGGGLDMGPTAFHKQLSVNEAGERLVFFGALAARYPKAKLVYTGGSGSILSNWNKEAELLKGFLSIFNLDPERVIFETEARNTYENVKFTKKLTNPQPDEVWILITSASHMPRAVGVFRHFKWNLMPCPVDYQTSGSDFTLHFDFLIEKGRKLSTGLREWTGLLYYWMMGYTEDLYPGP